MDILKGRAFFNECNITPVLTEDLEVLQYDQI